MTKTIALSKNKFAIVDDVDYQRVNAWRWQALKACNTWYAYRKDESGKNIRMHRFIFGLIGGDKNLVDHRDGDGLDNRRSNLRLASKQENNRNSRKHRDASISIFKGVHWEQDTRRWRAYIYLNKKKIWLGRFSDEKSAANAYNTKARKLFGEYALLNQL